MGNPSDKAVAVAPGMDSAPGELTPEDLEALKLAVARLEFPSLAARMTDALASPLGRGLARLPGRWSAVVHKATRLSIEKGLVFAIATVKGPDRPRRSRRLHKIAAAACGVTGGALGLAALPIELPLSTVLMLRSISEIARSEGEDLRSPETMMNCLQVFALGGRSSRDDGAEAGYYAVRAALSKAVSEAVEYVGERGVTSKGAPILVRFVAAIASRFGIVVSEEIAAMAIPAIGALGGALVNTAFMSHFQNVAQGHFVVRRLERRYGTGLVRSEYRRVRGLAGPRREG